MKLVQHILHRDLERIRSRLGNAERVRERLAKERARDQESTPDAFVRFPFQAEDVRSARADLDRLGLLGAPAVFLIGMGGSQRGTRAAASALGLDRLVSVETMDEKRLGGICSDLAARDSRDAVFIMASKSGTTAETIAAAEFISARLPWARERMVCITKEGSPLWKDADRAGIPRFPASPCAEGRFSVFSLMGMVPLLLVGGDAERILQGAAEQTTAFLEGAPEVFDSAMLRVLHANEGRIAQVSFLFEERLLDVGMWERQLTAESLGKNRKGILPLVSGPSDLHSMLQLYLGGPDMFFFTMIREEERRGQASGEYALFPEAAEGLEGAGPAALAGSIEKGVLGAFLQEQRPFQEIVLSVDDSLEIGRMMQFRMLETIAIAEAMGIDPYGQEKVEGYKRLARAARRGRHGDTEPRI